MSPRFSAKSEKIVNGPGRWDYCDVRIFEFDGQSEREIGKYTRNYPSFLNTFCPFEKNGQWFALYSKEYTATRVMTLPGCQDIGGEKPSGGGFCPVDYFVPYDEPNVVKAGTAGSFGFVAGCVWGDDSSWKIQFLDLSNVESGSLKREAKYGYISIPDSLDRLSKCFSFIDYDPPEFNLIHIAADQCFDVDSGEPADLP